MRNITFASNMIRTITTALPLLLSFYLTAQPPSMEWFTAAGSNFEEHVHEGMQTTDGGYIGVGNSWEGNSTQFTDFMVIKTDANGVEQWQQVIGTNNKYDLAVCVAEVSDGYVVGGGLHQSGNQQRALVLSLIHI